jgi:hypothetical protein
MLGGINIPMSNKFYNLKANSETRLCRNKREDTELIRCIMCNPNEKYRKHIIPE